MNAACHWTVNPTVFIEELAPPNEHKLSFLFRTCDRKWLIWWPILPKVWGKICTVECLSFQHKIPSHQRKFSWHFSHFCVNIGRKVKPVGCFKRWYSFAKIWVRRLWAPQWFSNVRTHGRIHGGQMLSPNWKKNLVKAITKNVWLSEFWWLTFNGWLNCQNWIFKQK